MMLLPLAIILMGEFPQVFLPISIYKEQCVGTILYCSDQGIYPHRYLYLFLISSNLTERIKKGEKERKENDRTKKSIRQPNKQYVAFASDESLLYKTMQKVINKDLILILYVLPNHHLIMAGNHLGD